MTPAEQAAHTAPVSSARATRLIVGCGYLGMRVAERWLAAGDRVFAVTRTAARGAALAAEGVAPILCDVTGRSGPAPRDALRGGPDFDTVFWAVGFDRTAGATHHDVHVGGLAALLDALSGRPRVILSSSTGVWGDEAGGTVSEATPVRPARDSGRALVDAEAVLRSHARGPGVALRFAGLYGPGRLPRLDDLRAGRPIAADPDSWLNLIHADDAAAVVCAVAEAAATRPLYVVSDGHPVRRRDWYGRLAAVTDSPSPTWDLAAPRSRGADKRVDPSLLFRDVSVTLEHPDPLGGLESALRG